MTASKLPRKGILKRMFRLLQTWRYVRFVNKKTKSLFLDNELYKSHTSTDEGFNRYPLRDECIVEFRVYTKNKRKQEFVARRAYKMAYDRGYIHPTVSDTTSPRGSQAITAITDKGEHFIEGFGWGYLRELISVEWKFISIVSVVLGYIIGRVTI